MVFFDLGVEDDDMNGNIFSLNSVWVPGNVLRL